MGILHPGKQPADFHDAELNLAIEHAINHKTISQQQLVGWINILSYLMQIFAWLTENYQLNKLLIRGAGIMALNTMACTNY